MGQMPNDFRLAFNTGGVTRAGRISTIVILNYIMENSAPRFSCIYSNIARNVARLGLVCSVPFVFNLLAASAVRRSRSHTNNGCKGGKSRTTMATLGVMGFSTWALTNFGGGHAFTLRLGVAKTIAEITG